MVAVEDGWLKTLVRSSKEEVDRSQLSHVVVKDTCFCLVEAAMEQMRIGGPSEAMDLGEENKDLLAAANVMLESEDDLNFATASDIVTRKTRKKKAMVETSSDSGEEDGVSSELLQDLRKNWLGSGTTADKKKNDVEQPGTAHRRSKRFSLIEKGRRRDQKGEGPTDSEAAQVMLKAALGANDPLHGLLALPDSTRHKKGSAIEEASPAKSFRQQQPDPELFKQFKLRKPGKDQGTLKGRCELSQSRSAKVPQATQICAQVCAPCGGGVGSPRQTIPTCGFQQEDPLWEAARPEEMPLLGEHQPGMAVEGGTAQGSAPSYVDSAGHAPSSTGSELGHSMAPNPCGRGSFQIPVVRRRRGVVAACDGVSEEHERAGKEYTESQAKGRRSRRDRRCIDQCSPLLRKRKGEEQQQDQGERQGQGQGCQRELSHASDRPCNIDAGGILPQMPVVQCLEGSWGSFGRFWKILKSSYQSHGYKGLGPMTPSKDQGEHLFPSLLVVPEFTGESKGSRRRARRRDRLGSWRYAEMMWAYFCFLDAGSPHKTSDQHRVLHRASQTPWTPMHSKYAGFLHEEINRYIRLQCDSEPLSRGILKISELVKVISNSSYTNSPSVDKLARVAKNVEPSRMSLPAAAGIVDPRRFLKGHHLETFDNLASCIPHGVEPAVATKGCFKVEPKELFEVNSKLLRSGVATLIPESMGLKDSHGNIITGGLFAVDHKPSSDRIILDRRPFNELERRLVWAKLPHGSLLTQLIVPPGYSIRGSGDDLSNYFYLLKHNQDWLPRNAIGKAFDGEGYEEWGGEKGKMYLLSFRVIAMGDLNAVDLAQQVHLEILQDAECMKPGESLMFKEPLPASHTLEGLYIDDHIITQILPKKKYRRKSDTYRDEELLAKSRSQYKHHGIPTSENKVFAKAEKFTAWGTEVDSKSGRVGTPLIKLKQLSQLLSSVCRLKSVSKKLLQAITGLLVHPFMHRRSLMCILQDTFMWIERLKEGESRPLPVAVREELLCSGLMLPLCHSNIR